MTTKPYKVELPQNYSELRVLGNQIHETIIARKIPQPEQVAKVLGTNSVQAYYLMHALMWAIEHKRGTGIPEYKRRDKKAIQRHSYDAAFKPFYRFQDRHLPSRYFLTEREIKGVLAHDLGEEFGQSLLGALVVNDIITYLLGETTGRDADLLTNKNALLLDPLEKEVNKLAPSKIDHRHVYDVFQKLQSEVRVEPTDIIRQYKRVQSALRSFKDHVFTQVDYMPYLQKKALLGVIDELIIGVGGKIRGSVLEARLATDQHVNQYGNVLSIINSGNYDEADRRLVETVSSEDPIFLVTLKKTLYRDHVKRIAAAVKSDAASVNGQILDNSYSSPFIMTLADSTDTAVNLDLVLVNATSIHRKNRIKIEIGVDLVEFLKESQRDKERLQRAVEYLFGNLYDSVNKHLKYLERKVQSENTLEPDLHAFRIMKDKMDDLEKLVDSMEGSSWFTATLKSGKRLWEGVESRLREAHLI